VPYTVEIVSRAEKEYLKLPPSVRDQVRKKVLSLEKDPKPFGSKKLRETENPFLSHIEKKCTANTGDAWSCLDFRFYLI
jgi:mRNA-degrading endonuclease RelE of RelBE toxin-antitoxin system